MAQKTAKLENDVREVPPSGKLVLKVLEYNGYLTQKEIVKRTRLPQRTVRDAINRLQDRGILEKGAYIPDGRKNLYTLSGGMDGRSGEGALTTE